MISWGSVILRDVKFCTAPWEWLIACNIVAVVTVLLWFAGFFTWNHGWNQMFPILKTNVRHIGIVLPVSILPSSSQWRMILIRPTSAVVTSYRLLKAAATVSKIYGFGFGDKVEKYMQTKMWIDISIREWNVAIALPSENKQPPYWNYTSGFNVGLAVACSSMWFCIGLRRIIEIAPPTAKSHTFPTWMPQNSLLFSV